MKRIVIVASALGAGGAERVIATVAAALAQAGRTVTVVTFDAPHDPIYHPIDPRVATRRLGLPGGSGGAAARTIRRIAALRGVLREADADLAISFLTKINVLTLLAAWGLRIPVIVSERNHPRRQQAHWAWNAALAVLYHRAARIVLMCERMRAIVPRGARGRVAIIPNPVDIPGDPAPACARRFVAVGRLAPQKGFDLLLDAFARIAAAIPEWSLTIYGDGPERAALERQRDLLGLTDRVSLPGVTARPLGWIADAGAFVLSSRHEGWPNALAEAMAAGLPVVAADCEFGVAELVRGGETGLLVPEGDRAALAQGMARLASDAPLRARLARNARRSTRRFSAASVCRHWLGLVDAQAPRRHPRELPLAR